MTLAETLFLCLAIGGIGLYGVVLFSAWVLTELIGGKAPRPRRGTRKRAF